MNDPVKVLVIEDDEILREVLVDVLSARGLEVTASSRGDMAVEMARHERFDLIVADIRMEGVNGLDAIEQARELQPDVGSIVVSGYASEEETLRAVRLNVAGYLKKPFEVPDLLELINNYLARRAERLRREQEQRGLREALLWSLEQQGYWAEEARPGKVKRPTQLAGRLAQELGFPADIGKQTILGTLLKRLEQLGGSPPGEHAFGALESYPTLVAAWRQTDPESLAELALRLCADLSEHDGLPEVTGLSDFSDKLLEAYRRVRDSGTESEMESFESPVVCKVPSGLLALARTLEHGGDLDGARAAFEKVNQEAGVSQIGLAGLLGKARVALAQGTIPLLEKSMSELLTLAEKLGPVTLALAELEGAKILQRAGHPAAQKLLGRASHNLGRANLAVPWAVATVSLAALISFKDVSPELLKALQILSLPQHQQEMMEHFDALVPSLLMLGDRDEAGALASRLIREYPHDFASQLKAGRLAPAAKACLVDLLISHGAAVPESLLVLLGQDPDPDIRARAVTLQADLGRSESVAILRVHSLGPIEISLGDQPLDDKTWKTQKTKLLFAKLADHFPRPISVDRVMLELWPDSDQAGARNNLNAAVSNMRRILRSGPKAYDPVIRSGDMLGLNPEQPFWHDVKEFELADLQARKCLESGNVEGAMSHLGRMVRLYQGSYLEGFYLDWISQRQLVLENRAVEALGRLTEHRAEQHRYREALEYALRLILLQPEHGKAHSVAMTSYLGLEQHDKATAHFEAHKSRLEEELEEQELIELTKLYHMARYGFVQEPSFKVGP